MTKKVILNHECPYRSKVAETYYCEHPSLKIRYCSWVHGAATNCPITTEELRSLKIKKIIKK